MIRKLFFLFFNNGYKSYVFAFKITKNIKIRFLLHEKIVNTFQKKYFLKIQFISSKGKNFYRKQEGHFRNFLMVSMNCILILLLKKKHEVSKSDNYIAL